MAAHERLLSQSNNIESIATIASSHSLIDKLATILPKSVSFKIYHLSTPPTRTSSLYSAPPGARPDRTYCTSHFLSASIQTPSPSNENASETELVEVLIFAIEILIYSTAYDTTFFVSKADSTGYLHLLGLQKGTPSPIRDISATFLGHLVKQHQRENIQSVVSLFARAQDQYLFPGSVEYKGKHVLDDRGLVKWWCRVLDPLVGGTETTEWKMVKGYLIVPGLDTHETSSYIPARAKVNPANSPWVIGHPLQKISRHAEDVPPRCLIPHYPDDPKARYLDELDEELSKGKNDSSGRWKSVKSIDQFWDMMAFRQECSAGRLVGFIWVVLTPATQNQPTESVAGDSQSTVRTVESQPWDTNSSFPPLPLSSPATSFIASSQAQLSSSPGERKERQALIDSQKSAHSSKPSTPSKKKKLTGPIIPRQPRIKTENKNYLLEMPSTSPYYSWQPSGRGQVIVSEPDYKRITELLLRLDFANLELASSSSKRWINEVKSSVRGAMSDAWGEVVVGKKEIEVRERGRAEGVNMLNLGLVRKKRKVGDTKEPAPEMVTRDAPKVHILTSGMIRKKAKA